MKKHYNIPIFVPHQGCPNDCVFCDQKQITGQSGEPDIPDIKEEIEKQINIVTDSLDKNPVKTEIAFFGGSFTGLEIAQMEKYLKLANEYIEKYKIDGIRLSTRPDYISPQIIDILRRYNVTSVELGIQSMDDDVLAASGRGHTPEDSKRACALIKSAGLALTGQIMLGLPGSNFKSDMQTAEELAHLGIDSARIYPTIVLQGTRLYTMYKSGEYVPLELDEAILRAKEIKKLFDSFDIAILRMGLCSSDNINTKNCIGPYHPAFGELVEGELLYDKLSEEIKNIKSNSITIRINKKTMSKLVGHKKKNIERLKNLKTINIIEDNSINSYKIQSN